MLGSELLSRDCGVSVSWVKGHATVADVDRGRTTSEDKAGNDGADKLAVDGAAMHRVPPEVVAAAQARRQTAKRTHEMMVAILIERQKQENLIAENDPDRGSEMGDGGLDVDDVEPEPLGCDGSDVDNGEFAIDHTGDRACVHNVHSCFNSLDDVSDARC